MSDLCHSDVCSPIILQKQEVGERTSSDLLHLDVICTSAFWRVGNLLNSYLQTNDFHAICHSNRITELLPVLPPLQVTFQDKAISMKQSTKRIGLIILIVVLTIIECLLCLGIALDGKYQVEFSEDLAAIEAFYRDVTILEIFMFINLGVAIVALCLPWRKNNDKDKSPDNKPNQ